MTPTADLTTLTRSQKLQLLELFSEWGGVSWVVPADPKDVMSRLVSCGVECNLDYERETLVFLGAHAQLSRAVWGGFEIRLNLLLDILIDKSGLSLKSINPSPGVFTHVERLKQLAMHWGLDHQLDWV